MSISGSRDICPSYKDRIMGRAQLLLFLTLWITLFLFTTSAPHSSGDKDRANLTMIIVNETKLRLKVMFAISQWLNRDPVLYKDSKYFNRHWAQYSTLCHPCHIDYDYIVKFETMREDAAYVLSKLGPHHECLEDKYPELFNSSQSTSSVYDSQFSTLSPEQISSLREIYSIDFKLFGYES